MSIEGNTAGSEHNTVHYYFAYTKSLPYVRHQLLAAYIQILSQIFKFHTFLQTQLHMILQAFYLHFG